MNTFFAVLPRARGGLVGIGARIRERFWSAVFDALRIEVSDRLAETDADFSRRVLRETFVLKMYGAGAGRAYADWALRDAPPDSGHDAWGRRYRLCG